jgi:hypothetical protein
MKRPIFELATTFVFAVCSVGLSGCGDNLAADDEAVRGELEVLIAETDTGGDTIHLLHAEDGRILSLDLRDAAGLTTGARIAVVGDLVTPAPGDDRSRLTVRSFEHLSAARSDRVVSPLIGQPISRTSRIMMLLVHWSAPNSMTPAAARAALITNQFSVRNHYFEASYGQHEMVADVFGWLTIPPVSSCDHNAIRDRALAAAVAFGLDPNAYDNVIIYFPRFTQCGWSTLGQRGSLVRPARYTWHNGTTASLLPRLTSHLLGYNFGLFNSQAYRCGSAAMGPPTSCVVPDAYGDVFDPMGRGFSHFNAYEKKLLGWLGRCNMVTAPAGGTFNIRMIETASNNVQAVRVPVAASLCPTGIGAPCEYVVEYRLPIGFDGQGAGISGVQVRLASSNLTRSSYLLDMTPQTTTFEDAALGIARTFQDPNGVAISVTSLNATRATVNVTVPQGTGQATCLDGSAF